ncbi:Wall-associated receptor kinase 3 [Dichanthelium oligosanthes]|uniref:Wall-associated receptor kinase 3 n=1 Tax=Dichanthelium oligosanthes TaxID=888268 RepID=A0A1E5V9J8_9POAL|nr:Wall-associated receptor kinase 3 [Dichanthelium oligosanthes]
MQSHLLLAVLWLAAAAVFLAAGSAVRQPSSNCQRKCGEVDIPYPFGIGPDDCAIMPDFILMCDNTSGGGPFVSFPPDVHHVDVESISLLQGKARMLNRISSSCYNTTSREMQGNYWVLNFTTTPYRFSNTDNKFTVIGCNTLAYIQDYGNKGYTSGCVAICKESDTTDLTDGSCSGIGCCQTAIPKGLQSYLPTFDLDFNTTQIYNFSACSYAVLMDTTDFIFQMSYVTSPDFNRTGGKQPLAIDWAIGNETCDVASKRQDSYACVSRNSQCFNSTNGPGYICNCTKGYEGNPYLQDPEQGCRDIDECKDKDKYPCFGKCSNTEGGFDCFCPPGTQGNATTGPCMTVVTKQVRIAIGIFATVFFVLIILLGLQWIKHNQRIIRHDLISKRDAYFRLHGGQLLIDMMKIENNISFKLYCLEEIELATNNFDDRQIIGEGGQGTVYIGYDLDPDNNPVAIKRCKRLDENRMTEFGQELLILSRVTHKNIVKLLGCSLHFEAPVLVYEFVPNKTLHYLIHVQDEPSKRTLEIRLKIAAESAEALAYLHTLNHPIFHGDVKSANILLGDDLSAKVSDFGCSLIRSAEENLHGVKGTMGYLDPEYLLNFNLNDKSDVYSFGVVLLEIITRRTALSKAKESLISVFKDAVREGRLVELVDPEIANQDNMEAVCQVAALGDKCLAMTGASRPTMSHVAEELRQLVRPVLHGTGELHVGNPFMVHAWSSSSAPYDYTGEETTDYYSQKKKAAMSIEFAR